MHEASDLRKVDVSRRKLRARPGAEIQSQGQALSSEGVWDVAVREVCWRWGGKLRATSHGSPLDTFGMFIKFLFFNFLLPPHRRSSE
jgi:hypothetical protein